MKKSLKSKRGQNTAEYILLLALVCGGAIGVFSVFGGTIQGMLVNVTSAFTGKGADDTSRVKMDGASSTASKRISSLKNLETVDGSNPFEKSESGSSEGTSEGSN